MFGRKKKDPNAPKKVRFKTIRDAYSLARKHYKFVFLRCLAVFTPLWGVGIGIGLIFNRPGYAAFLTFPLAFLGAFFYFTRLAGNAAYASIEGQPGAGASVLQLQLSNRPWSLESKFRALAPALPQALALIELTAQTCRAPPKAWTARPPSQQTGCTSCGPSSRAP